MAAGASKQGEVSFLFKHTTIYTLGNLALQGASFALLPFYTRYLSPEDYGIVALIGVTTGMLSIVLGMGVSEAMSRFYYDFKQGERSHVISTSYFLLSAIMLAGISLMMLPAGWISQLLLDSREYTNLIRIAFATLGLSQIVNLGFLYMRFLHRSMMFVGVSILSTVITISANIYFIAYEGYGVWGFFYGNISGYLFLAIPLTIWVLGRTGVRYDAGLAWQMATYSGWLIVSQVLDALVNYSDRFFIKVFVSIADTGIYEIANKLGTAIHTLLTVPFNNVFIPRRFEVAAEGNADYALPRAYDVYMLMITTAALAVALVSDQLLTLMTTPPFYPAAQYIPLIVLAMVIRGMMWHFEFGILYSKKTRYVAMINFTAAAFHLVLNYVTIRAYGVWGALISYNVSLVLHTVMLYTVSQRMFYLRYNLWRNARLLAVAIAVYLVSLRVSLDGTFIASALERASRTLFDTGLEDLAFYDVPIGREVLLATAGDALLGLGYLIGVVAAGVIPKHDLAFALKLLMGLPGRLRGRSA